MASTTAQNRSERNLDNATSNRDRASASEENLSVLSDFQSYTREYVHQHPENAAMICLGIGFILGWKLKPW
ncbi:MAG: DUF883 C-terminal domain-containing protein [Planctomycetaceae bacterium]